MFNLYDYFLQNKDVKVKVFIEFLMKELSITSYKDFKNEYFEIIDDDLLIRSLEYYINRQKATAKITAQNYITNITKFFNMIADEYGLKNDVFKDLDKNTIFKIKANKIIQKLNDTSNKEIASEQDYIALNRIINAFIDRIDNIFNEITLGIEHSIEVGSNRTDKYFDLLSCTATKLVLLYGLKNNVITDMRIDDIDIDAKTIKVSKYFFHLDSDLVSLLYKYLECRSLILRLINKNSNYLFINNLGNPLVDARGNVTAERVFKIVKSTFNHLKIETFANRRKIEMIRSGQDLCSIADKTGSTVESCEVLQRLFNEEVNSDSIVYETNEEIKPFSFDEDDNDKRIDYTESVYMKCPNCHSYVSDAESDWVLVLKDNGVKYLACINCKGSTR